MNTRAPWFVPLLIVAMAHPVSAQWVASVYLGDAATPATTVTLDDAENSTRLTLDAITFEDESWQSPVYYGGRIARFFQRAPWLAIEAEFIHLKVVADTAAVVRVRGTEAGATVDERRQVSAVLPRLSLSHGLNFALANVVFRVPLRTGQPSSRVSLLARVGAGPTIPHVEATLTTDSADGYQWGRVGLHAAGGAEVSISKRIALCLEAKRTATRQVVRVGSTELAASFATRHFVAGITYRLQPR